MTTGHHHHLPVLDPRPFGHSSEADKRHLWRIDDALHELDALVAEIRDGDRRIGHLGAAQRQGAGPGDEVGERAHQRVEVHGIDVVERRRDQAALAQRNRDAEMHASTGHEAILLEEAVELGILAKRERNGLEQRHRHQQALGDWPVLVACRRAIARRAQAGCPVAR